jgi:hypothetical protein
MFCYSNVSIAVNLIGHYLNLIIYFVCQEIKKRNNFSSKVIGQRNDVQILIFDNVEHSFFS